MPVRGGYWGTTKPPPGVAIDPGHPLTRGLLAYWPLGNGASTAQDIWGPYPLISSGIGANLTDGVGTHGGPCAVFRGNPEQLYSYPITDAIAGRSQVTMAGWLSRTGTGNVATFGWAPNTSFRCFLIWFTDSNVYAVIENGATAGRNISLPGIGWHHFVVSYDGARSASERNRLYIDGVRAATALVVADAPANLGTVAQLTNFSIGYDFSDNQFQAGSAEDCAVWGRALTDEDALALYTQPYAMFAPPVWRRFFIPVSAAGVTGTAAGSTGARGQTLGVASRTAATTGHTGTHGQDAGASVRTSTNTGQMGTHGQTAGVAARTNTTTGHTGVKGQTAAVATRRSAIAGQTATHAQDLGVAARASTVTGRSGTAGQTVAVPRRTNTVSGHTGPAALDVGASARSGVTTGHTGTHGLPTSGGATQGLSRGYSGTHGQTAGVATRLGTITGQTATHGQTSGAAIRVTTVTGHAATHGQTAATTNRASTVSGHAGTRGQATAGSVRTGSTQGHAATHGQTTGATVVVIPVTGPSACLARWGESRWGDYRWGEVGDLIVILGGTLTPTGALVRVPQISREGTLAPSGALEVPPQWVVVHPPSHPGGYPVGTRRQGAGQQTETDQVPARTEDV